MVDFGRNTVPFAPRLRSSCKRFLASAVLVLVPLIMTGCAKMSSTKSLPFTEFPPPEIVTDHPARTFRIAVRPFDISATEITGGHHEGLLQVRQPGIWGLSEGQREALYRDLGDIARYAFIDELLKRKQSVTIVGDTSYRGAADYVISGTLRSVELNTYGQGTREGWGSAGNYWEAEVVLSDVVIARADGTVLWSGEIDRYCKLEGSPAKLDWTVFTVVAKSLQQGLILSQGPSPVHIQDAVESSGADYQLAPVTKNPVDIAARLAALEVLKIIAEQRSGESKRTGRH